MMRSCQKSHSTKSGFTIVEVSLATALLSVLLIAISTVIINITQIYQRGTVIKSLNSVGRSLVDDIDSAIEAALPIDKIGGSSNPFSNYYYSSSERGVFCPGQYSYIWSGPESDINVTFGTRDTMNGIRLVKVKDSYRHVCRDFKKQDQGDKKDFTFEDIDDTPEELLSGNDVDLYVRNFKVNDVNSDESALNQDSAYISEVFFSGSFELVTKRGAKDTDPATQLSNCQPSDEDFTYCAVNKFKFAARTAGKVEKK